MNGKRLFKLLVSATFSVASFAQAPSGYYASCEGKSGQALLTALYNTISPHTTVSYDGLWEVYKTSDVRENGTVWDMYSTKEWVVGAEHCGNYSSVGDCINREHSVPQSWFNSASPMKSDAFHVYPTDGKVNGQRSNYPFGECSGGTTLPSSGGVKALGRVGTCTFPGYTGKVFEPDDEYKGDFARTYFYMATCYNDRISSWSGAVIAGNSYPCYSSWAVGLFLKWHRQDPVSQKEIVRNNAVYVHQKNRNPYIDYPDLAEHVWGSKVSEAWSAGGTVDPAISQPVDGSVVDIGVTAVNVPRSVVIPVKGVALADDVTVRVVGEGFSVSSTTLSVAEVNSEAGASVTASYVSAAAVSAAGTITFSSGSCSSVVELSVSAIDGLPAGEATDITQSSFVAHWVNIDGDSPVDYSIALYKDGVMVDGYPVSVPAADERYTVDGLDPETVYTYTVSSPAYVSNAVTVTTAAPVPVLQFSYEGEMSLSATPGTPSDAVEVGIYAECIEEDIVVSVSAPFEVSTDKSAWAQNTVLDALEDRFYLRINAEKEGTYTTVVNAVSGECYAETLDFVGHVVSSAAFIEDFEQDATGMGSYTPSVLYNGSASVWKFSDAGIWSSDTSRGEQSARFGKTSSSYIEMTEDKPFGAGTVSFYIARWGNDAEAAMELQYSVDGGNTWIAAGSVAISSGDYTMYSVAVNKTGNIRLRFQQTAGKRFNIDDIEIPDYTSSSGIEAVGMHGEWDAYCAGGELVVECHGNINVMVCSVDGVVWYDGSMAAGTGRMRLPHGLYIVSSGDVARRVLVK